MIDVVDMIDAWEARQVRQIRLALGQSWLALGRLGCLSVICLPQSSACQRSLVEVRPTIPVCTLVGSVGLCVRLGLTGASNPLAQSRNETNSSWVNGADKSGFIFQICASGAAVQASHPATIKLTHYRAFRLDV